MPTFLICQACCTMVFARSRNFCAIESFLLVKCFRSIPVSVGNHNVYTTWDCCRAVFTVSYEMFSNLVTVSLLSDNVRALEKNHPKHIRKLPQAHERYGNVKKCAVGKYPKSEKLGSAGQAACCACAHSRYLTGGSPSGLRV